MPGRRFAAKLLDPLVEAWPAARHAQRWPAAERDQQRREAMRFPFNLQGSSNDHCGEPPDPDGQQRQDEDGEQDVGERAVAVGDQRDEAEAAGQEHADDQQGQRESPGARDATARSRAAPARLGDALVDRVDGARAAFEQRGEDHQLEQQVEQGRSSCCSRKSDGSVASLDVRVEGDHADEEEQRRQHRQRPGEQARRSPRRGRW